MNKLLVFIVISTKLLTSEALANWSEQFGSSAANMAVGNQATFLAPEPANMHYSPSVLASIQSSQFSFQTYYFAPHLNSIDNITLNNQVTSNETNQIGNDNKLSAQKLIGLYFATPLTKSSGLVFLFGLTLPTDTILSVDTQNPYSPHYLMYENRLTRPLFEFHLAKTFNQWNLSLGARSGFQTNGQSTLYTRTNSETEPSSGNVQFSVKPSFAPILSLSRNFSNFSSGLTYKYQMKNSFSHTLSGETAIGGGGSLPLGLKLQSLFNFDPHTIGFWSKINKSHSNFLFGIDYQLWKEYESSFLHFTQTGGAIKGGSNLSNLELQNILIPRLGYERFLNDSFIIRAGYFYQPSITKNISQKDAGNYLDPPKHVLSYGLGHVFEFMSQQFQLSFAHQIHLIKNYKINKTDNLENGNAGPKIGSQGYRVGGQIHALSLGLSWSL